MLRLPRLVTNAIYVFIFGFAAGVHIDKEHLETTPECGLEKEVNAVLLLNFRMQCSKNVLHDAPM